MQKATIKDVLFKCTSCNFEERIPIEAVYFFDIFDPDDVNSPPCVGCNICSSPMIPHNLST